MSASTDELYPPTPPDVPGGLTAATPTHRRHVWLAMGGLLGFVGLYLAFTGWFGWLTFRLVRDALNAGSEGVGGWFLAVGTGFLFVFLAKGLFKVRHHRDTSLIEVDAGSEPRLVEFIERIATEAGAPKPHRIYLSAHVNAAVFHDLSFRDLILPRKKNLEIGLGLVNVLTLDELKAVVAHEFGHFAQRSTAIGGWVYVAEQVVGHVVVARDGFDRVLEGLSRTDIRIAWIGWLLRLVVWAMRAVLDTAYRGLLVLRRALSREMEFQADLVSVSLCGSDSLVHALHRLQSADDAWGVAANFVSRQLSDKTAVVDLFSIQSHFEKRHAEIRDDDSGLSAPAVPESDAEGHRVFRAQLAHPPKMWSSHPPNHEREDNAKRRYVRSPIDSRSAWSLFSDPIATRREATRRLIAEAEHEGIEKELGDEEAIAMLDEQLDRASYDRRYQGAYLGRAVTRFARSAEELYGDVDTIRDLREDLEHLYPAALREELEAVGELEEQHAMLVALKEGFLDAPGGVIRYRGRELRRRELGDVIVSVERERDEARRRLIDRDRDVRTVHRAAARSIDPEWETYLVSLAALLHYAEHCEADLDDAFGVLLRVIEIVMADGRVTDSEMTRVVATAFDVHHIIETIHGLQGEVFLPKVVREALEVESFEKMLPQPFDLPPPTRLNFANDYLGALESWVRAMSGIMRAIRRQALEALVVAEAQVADAVREGEDLPEAPLPARVPRRYPTLLVGSERERQKKLGWWDAFVTADGWIPGTVRLLAACAVLSVALLASNATSEGKVIVQNGLARVVVVRMGNQEVRVAPHQTETVRTRGDVAVTARLKDGTLIESFTEEVDRSWIPYVYNVARASALVEWTAVYGSHISRPPDRPLGAPRWILSGADVTLQEPPDSISSDSGGTRDVLAAADALAPISQVRLVSDPEEREALVLAHLTYDPTTGDDYIAWAQAAEGVAGVWGVLRARVDEGGVVIQRAAMDAAPEDERAALCATFVTAAEREPDDGDRQYIAIRCRPEGEARSAAFVEAYEKSGDNAWLAYAAYATYQELGRFEDSERAARLALANLPRALAPYLALDVVRLERFTKGTTEVEWHDLRLALGPAVPLLEAEQPSTPGQPTPLLTKVAHGRIGEAWNEAKRDPDLAVLVAASDGASEEMVKGALGVDPAQLAVPALVAGLALARREGADSARYEAALREKYPRFATHWATHLDPTTLAKDPLRVMERLTEGGSLVDRGLAYAAGAVILADRAPAEWRQRARWILFVHQRPYFAER